LVFALASRSVFGSVFGYFHRPASGAVDAPPKQGFITDGGQLGKHEGRRKTGDKQRTTEDRRGKKENRKGKKENRRGKKEIK
jgi:hypothetical protein